MYTIDTTTLLIAFGLTLFAGLSTGIGSLMSFFSKEFSPKFLAASLGFSAGVMIYVSLIEIFVKARIALEGALGPRRGYMMTTVAFFVGIAVIALIDKLIPDAENPHEIPAHHEGGEDAHTQKLMRMFFSALPSPSTTSPRGSPPYGGHQRPALGVSIAIAIALHNIPEGVAVSVPIYYATKSRKKAFLYGTLSGLAEPVGAFVGYFLLRRWFNDMTFGFVFASIAGIMVYISLDELLPTAEEYGEHHIAIGGVMAGMIVMAISLVLLA